MEAESSSPYEAFKSEIAEFNQTNSQHEKRQLLDNIVILMEIFNERRKAYKFTGLYEFENDKLLTCMQHLLETETIPDQNQPLNKFYIQWEYAIDSPTAKLDVKQARDKPTLIIKNHKKKINQIEKKVYVINLDEWSYNPLFHVHQPNFYVLDAAKKSALLEKYNIKESQIPKMDCGSRELDKKDSGPDKEPKGDIVGRFLGFAPGEIILIEKKTFMNGQQDYFRIVK